MAGQQKGGKNPTPLQAPDDLLFERRWIRKLRLSYRADEILEAPEILIETIERGQDTQDDDCQDNPARLFRRRDLVNEKKDHNVTNQIKKKIAAEGIVYGMKGIKNSQGKEDNKGQGESNPPDLQSPLCYPSIEPEKERPTEEYYL